MTIHYRSKFYWGSRSHEQQHSRMATQSLIAKGRKWYHISSGLPGALDVWVIWPQQPVKLQNNIEEMQMHECLEKKMVDGREILLFLDWYDCFYISHSEVSGFSLYLTEDVTAKSKCITDNHRILGTAQDAFISFICLTLTLENILLYQGCWCKCLVNQTVKAWKWWWNWDKRCSITSGSEVFEMEHFDVFLQYLDQWVWIYVLL